MLVFALNYLIAQQTLQEKFHTITEMPMCEYSSQ